ncbi:hypothetical protein AB0K43_14685 [Kitasatospora sp. NPDC049258]|uniref:hypothetical protein n=1 Tax=Kitasatospora sp. NPDC049258 TaxID=3155394 RepID=UPI0034253F68
MSQRRSYSNSNDFNMDDLFRPEPAGTPGDQQGGQPQPGMPQQQPQAPQQQAPGGGPEYWGAPPQPAPQGAPHGVQPEPAPETQHLPPYPRSEPGIGGGLPQQPMGGQQSMGGQQGYGAAQPFPAAPPQPGYGGQPSYGGQAQAPYGAAQPSYGGQQTFGGVEQGAQTFGGQQFGVPQQGPGYPAGEPGHGSAAGGRPSQKLIIGGVVAGCVAAGILVVVLMSGGKDDKGSQPPVAKPASSAPVAGGSGAVSPELQAQAKAMSDLLGKASASRQAVIGAVASVQKCDKLPESQAGLTAAAAQRDQLVTELAALKVDKLPTGPQLVDQLKSAWQASATADKEYAAWAGDSIAACDPAKQSDNPHAKNGNAASGTATTAKTSAADLWNAIAAQTGLPTKAKSDL